MQFLLTCWIKMAPGNSNQLLARRVAAELDIHIVAQMPSSLLELQRLALVI
jgi:hypothetical protein